MPNVKYLCANCAIVVSWRPTIVHGEAYCCAGCARGGPCECDYDHLPAREPVIRHLRFEIVVPHPTAAGAGGDHTNL